MGGVPRSILLAVTGAALTWAAPAVALDPPAAATPPTITSSPQSPGASRSLTFQFTGDVTETFECRLERPDATAVEDWIACSRPKTYTLDPAEPDGVYTFRVRAIDPLLGQSTEDSRQYTLDT